MKREIEKEARFVQFKMLYRYLFEGIEEAREEYQDSCSLNQSLNPGLYEY